MRMAGRADSEQRDQPPATLGDIIFAARERGAPESEWVALLRSIAERDERALHALYQRTHRIVFTLAMRITRSRETAEELTVDVFHDVWRRASEYDAAQGSVVGWVMNQARSRAIDRLRFEHRKKRLDPKPDDPAEAESASGPDDLLELEEEGRKLREALTLLTAQERQALETAFFSGLTHAEVAARLGEPLGTIKTRIRSGLSKLRQALGNGKVKP
jgi:RNA polymerase sigma-70 factor (ECF subfamily)